MFNVLNVYDWKHAPKNVNIRTFITSNNIPLIVCYTLLIDSQRKQIWDDDFPKFSAQIYIPLIFRIRRKLQTQAHFTSNVYVRQNGLHYQEDLEVVHVKLTQAIKGIFSISVKLWQVIISFSDAFQEVEQNVQLNYWVEGSLENAEAKVVRPK